MGLGLAFLIVVVAVPFLAWGICLRFAAGQPALALKISVGMALALVLTVSLAVVDVEIPLLAGRALILKSVAQLGIQLLGLAMLGFVMGLSTDRPKDVVSWLPVAWLSLGGLTLALLITPLPLALLAYFGSALIWVFGLPEAERRAASNTVMRFAALLALSMPVLLIAFRLADLRTASTPEIELLVLALAVPAFGLLLGVVPLHAWSLTVASGTPRPMLFGILLLVQTAGFGLLLRTLSTYPWMTGVAREALVVGGALSACAGGWLALSARRDDPDDWLLYAAAANSGMLLAGLGTQSAAGGAGVALLLFARVLALVILALAPRVSWLLRRLALAAGTLALAGTPGLVGFPGLWLILRSLQSADRTLANVAILAGSGFLFATAMRRWRADPEPPTSEPITASARGARRAVIALIALMIILGFAPQVIAAAFATAMQDLFFTNP
jgi:formate hydrogenlyase subunit 3/multisubunit Na+/H+ antiporter MnhD subunit